MPESSLIAVGNELLSGFTLDTNSHWLAARLFSCGFPVRMICTVGDVDADIVSAINDQLTNSAIRRVFVCGGLGPTPDDRTYAAIAHALGRRLKYDRPTGAQMQSLLFAMRVAMGRSTAELNAGNRRMAMVPEGATLLRNGAGMAPGLAVELERDRYLFALPGVPHELRALFDSAIEPIYLRGSISPSVGELHYRAVPESAFHDAMRALEAEFPDVSLGSYPQTERRELILRAIGPDPARVGAVLAEIRRRVSQYQPIEPAPA